MSGWDLSRAYRAAQAQVELYDRQAAIQAQRRDEWTGYRDRIRALMAGEKPQRKDNA